MILPVCLLKTRSLQETKGVLWMEKESVNAQDTPVVMNLSDLYMYYSYDELNYPAWLRSTGCRRFYIGSGFCSKYFLKSLGRSGNEICRYAMENECSLSVTVPVPSDRWTGPVKKALAGFLYDQPAVDEVTVNDYGMLDFVSKFREESGLDFSIAAGRLFFKNYRDPRYREQQEGKTVCFFPPVLAGMVDAVELDICSSEMDVSSIPGDIGIYYHYPFSYVTCTQYCEFASVINPETRRFRTEMLCGLKCMDAVIRTDADGAELIHAGKGVYTPVPGGFRSSRSADRYIYWPLREFLEMEGRML